MMIMMGLLGAFVYSSNRARKIGIDSDDLPIMYLLVAIAGVLGARLFYFVFSATDAFLANPLIFFTEGGGLVFYGGAIGGVITGVLFCRWKKISALKMADIGAPAIMLGLALGRVGCFLAGCCHGRPVEGFIHKLKENISSAHVQNWLSRPRSADDVFLAIAQKPESAQAVWTKLSSDPTHKETLSKLAEKTGVSMDMAPDAFFRALSEKLYYSFKGGGYPSAEMRQLSEGIMSSAGDEGWISLLSQADLLALLPHELQHQASEHVTASSLTGGNLPGGEVLLLHDAPTLSLSFFKGVGVGSIYEIPLYPTQIWEGLGAFSLFLALAWMWVKVRRFDGQIMVTMMIFYAGLRSSIETFRGDKIRGEDWFGLVSTSQLISVVMVFLAIFLGILLFPKGIAPEKPPIDDDDEHNQNDILDDLL